MFSDKTKLLNNVNLSANLLDLVCFISSGHPVGNWAYRSLFACLLTIVDRLVGMPAVLPYRQRRGADRSDKPIELHCVFVG